MVSCPSALFCMLASQSITRTSSRTSAPAVVSYSVQLQAPSLRTYGHIGPRGSSPHCLRRRNACTPAGGARAFSPGIGRAAGRRRLHRRRELPTAGGGAAGARLYCRPRPGTGTRQRRPRWRWVMPWSLHPRPRSSAPPPSLSSRSRSLISLPPSLPLSLSHESLSLPSPSLSLLVSSLSLLTLTLALRLFVVLRRDSRSPAFARQQGTVSVCSRTGSTRCRRKIQTASGTKSARDSTRSKASVVTRPTRRDSVRLACRRHAPQTAVLRCAKDPPPPPRVRRLHHRHRHMDVLLSDGFLVFGRSRLDNRTARWHTRG